MLAAVIIIFLLSRGHLGFEVKHVLTCMDSFDTEILDFEGIFHERYCVFRVL